MTQQGRTRKGHKGRLHVEGLGHTEQAPPSGQTFAKLEETVGNKPLPHVSAETASPAHAATTVASSRVLTLRGPGPILALHPVEALASPSALLALAPCCTSPIAARLACLARWLGSPGLAGTLVGPGGSPRLAGTLVVLASLR